MSNVKKLVPLSEDCRCHGRRHLRMTLEIAATGRPQSCQGNCRGPAMGCRGCYTGVYHGQNHGTCRGHNHDICRGSAMIRGPCRGHSRISTLAGGNTHGSPRKFHGHCHGPPPKSPTMCIPVGRENKKKNSDGNRWYSERKTNLSAKDRVTQSINSR